MFVVQFEDRVTGIAGQQTATLRSSAKTSATSALQTNLLRTTTVKDGVTNSIAHNFYHEGAYLGRYSQGGGYTFVNTAARAPYSLSFVWDSSNQIRTASVTTTNYVTLDSFTCTNGILYPVASSVIEESNRKTKDILHR